MKKDTLSSRRQLFSMTWPIFLEAALFSVIGSVDTLMLAGWSDHAVGAVGVVNQILALFQVISNIITTGTGILCAQYIGAGLGREKQQPLILGALLVNSTLGLLFSLGAVFGADLLLGMMTVPAEQYDHARAYMQIVGGGLLVQMVTLTFTVLIRSHGKTRATMVFSLVMNLINLVLNYVLIYGKLGLPTLGTSGAAIATVVSKCCACVMAGWFLFRKVLPGLSLRPQWKATRAAIGQVLAYGSPAAGEQISYTLSKIVVMAMVTSLGAVAVDTWSYVNIVVSYVYLFSMALGSGTSILVGWAVGRGDHEEADRLCRFSLRCSFLIAMAVLGVLVLVREPLMDLFTNDPAIIALGGSVIIANVVLEAGRSRNLVLVSALRAAGDVKFPLYIGLFSMWLFSVGFSWLLGIQLGFGLVGIWLGLGLDECFRAIGMQLRWKTGKWTTLAVGH
ncbi:MAG: MATE family efflux transporter [Oscillospiraceae bacterium]|nr:MATE family efflux transporter [Oscillospiraceae bacterium]